MPFNSDILLIVLAVLWPATAALAMRWWLRSRDLRRAQAGAEYERILVGWRLAAVMDRVNESIFIVGGDGRIVETNDCAERTYGYTQAEFKTMPVAALVVSHRKGDAVEGLASYTPGDVAFFEAVHRRKDGSTFSVEGTAEMLEARGDRFVIAVFRDVSERKAAELTVKRQHGLYLSLSQINQTIIHCRTADQLLSDICRVLVETGGFAMAWVGTRTEGLSDVTAVASHGDGSGYLRERSEAERTSRDEDDPVLATFRTGIAQVCHDTRTHDSGSRWSASVLRHGFGSLVCLPIGEPSNVWGVLTVYSAPSSQITNDDVALLAEAAGDIAFALENLRHEETRLADEKALRESEARLRRFVDADIVGVVTTDRDGKLVDANACFRRIIAIESPSGIALRDITPPEWSEADDRAAEQVTANGSCAAYEKELRRPDGSRVPVYVASAQLPGSERQIVTFVVDISATKEAERRTLDELEFSRTLLASLPVGVLVLGEAGRCIAVNDAVCRILRRDRAHLMSLELRQVEPTPFAEVLAIAEQAIEAGTEMRFEAALQLTEGAANWVSVRCVPFTHATAGHVLIIVSDITERKTSERRIREQAALLDKANEAIAVSDPAHRITFWSNGAERMLGWTFSEVAGKQLSSLLDARNPWSTEGARPGTTGAGWRSEIRCRNRNGELLTLEASVTDIVDDNGRPAGSLMIATDVSQKKKLEEAFMRAQRIESIGMLAAGIAHDLNNILAPIQMGVPLLRANATSPLDLRTLDTLEKCTERGAGLVRQILGFARGMSGEPQTVQVKHILRDVAEVVHETFPKSIVLEDDIPRDLWPVKANPTQLHQVLVNLCVNARDAMPNGGTLSIRAENHRIDDRTAQTLNANDPHLQLYAGPWLVIDVVDTGTGMTPEVLSRLGEPFFTTKASGKGTGLGVATVRAIVAAHRGYLSIRTEVGKGSRFRIFLPALEAAESVQRAPAGAEKLRRGNGELILWVDDEESIRLTASEILTHGGYRVVSAADGGEALELYQKHRAEIALVVTDLDMPGIGGDALASAVRQVDPAMKIIPVSGHSGSGFIAHPEAFAGEVLLKPFTRDALIERVAGVLEANPPPSA